LPAAALDHARRDLMEMVGAPVAADGLTWEPLIETARDPALLQSMLEVYQRLGDQAAMARVQAALAR